MPARKKNSKRKTKKNKHKKLDVVEIPVLTRRAPVAVKTTAPQPILEHAQPGHDQEIRKLVTLAVNESVPQIIDSIVAKLRQPIGTEPDIDQ